MIDSNDLIDLLKNNNLNYFYHANTVSTWCTFLEQSALLSRGYVEENNLWQTFQPSDQKDQQYNIFYDVFLDIKDMHNTFSQMNSYGPVTGVFSIEMIRNICYSIKITKNNPIYWENGVEYYSSIDEYAEQLMKALKDNNNTKIARMMITVQKPSDSLSLDFLNYIILDNPGINANFSGNKYDLFQDARDLLEQKIGERNILVKERICHLNCNCCKKYHSNRHHTAYFFLDKESIRHKTHKEF